jgi:hypothetical protein
MNPQAPSEEPDEPNDGLSEKGPADQANVPTRMKPGCRCLPPEPKRHYPGGPLVCATCDRNYVPWDAGTGGVVPPPEHRWRPGQSGNPLGRPKAGAAVADWLNIMSDWTQDEIEAWLADPAHPAAKRAAARTWKHATSDKVNKVGTPIAGDDLDRICDRTIGVPDGTVNINQPKQVNVVLVHTAPPKRRDSEPS